MHKTATQDVLYSVDGPIARVTLNRPKYRNARAGAFSISWIGHWTGPSMTRTFEW